MSFICSILEAVEFLVNCNENLSRVIIVTTQMYDFIIPTGSMSAMTRGKEALLLPNASMQTVRITHSMLSEI